MSFEQGSIIVIGSVTAALVFLFGLLWKRSEQCEKDRRELRTEVEALKEAKGLAHGELISYRRCPAARCPFKDDD